MEEEGGITKTHFTVR